MEKLLRDPTTSLSIRFCQALLTEHGVKNLEYSVAALQLTGPSEIVIPSMWYTPYCAHVTRLAALHPYAVKNCGQRRRVHANNLEYRHS